MGMFYDWEGQPITLLQWARLFEDARHIGDDELDGVRVSTVWLGLDHSFGLGPPLIYETMVFGALDLEGERYATEQEARAGHARWVELVRLELAVTQLGRSGAA
jgi:hypothetical protein